MVAGCVAFAACSSLQIDECSKGTPFNAASPHAFADQGFQVKSDKNPNIGKSTAPAIAREGDTHEGVLILMLMHLQTYTLGSSGAKLLLHWTSMAVLLPWCLGLMWSLAANGAGENETDINGASVPFLTVTLIKR